MFYTIILIGQMRSIIYKIFLIGRVAELVDALVLGTNSASCEGSSPFSPTNTSGRYLNAEVQVLYNSVQQSVQQNKI